MNFYEKYLSLKKIGNFELTIDAEGNLKNVKMKIAFMKAGNGNLEFHYFVGYSGGAKALAPGVCGRSTISNNHKHFLKPGAKAGIIEENPVREEIEEIGEMVGIDFIVNAVLNSHKN